MATNPVVGRLAPSPTGNLHLGHALSFIVAWWHARSQGGRVILRIEDVDVERARPEHIDAAQRDLEWLGLDWDGAPRLQSRDVERIVASAQRLLGEGRAYPCCCSRGDLKSLGAPQQGQDEVAYDGRCRGLYHDLNEAERESGKPAGLRFTVRPGPTLVNDENFGAKSFDVATEVGDFPILRKNKLPAYQLAVVVDDRSDGVTEVVRGADLLPSSARQVQLAEALGYSVPRYFHVPLLCDATGRRLAKREASLGLCELRELGVDPRAIVAFVAEVTGQHMGPNKAAELAPPSVWLAHFSAERVGTAPIRLGAERLTQLMSRA